MNKTLKLFIVILLFLSVIMKASSSKYTRKNYIDKYKKIALSEMKKYKIPASIKLAQGMLESGNGSSTLARRANNHFGIKCHNNWKGRTMKWTDDSHKECFRKYKKVSDSYRDHSLFLKNRERYAKLFKLETTDYRSWAYGLQEAGYATNKNYATLLINIIEDNRLYRFDNKKYQRKITNESYHFDTGLDDPMSPDLKNSMTLSNVQTKKRKIFTNNRVKFIFSKEGENIEKIAKEFKMYTWQIQKYNDLKNNDLIKEGQMIYIQSKKNRVADKKYHIVKEKESLYSISQLYGIKLSKLCKMNHVKENDFLQTGQQLKLR